MTAARTGYFNFSLSLRHPHPLFTGLAGSYRVVEKTLDFSNIQSDHNLFANFKCGNTLKTHLLKLTIGRRILIDILNLIMISGSGKKLFPFSAVRSGFGAVHNNLFHCLILLFILS